MSSSEEVLTETGQPQESCESSERAASPMFESPVSSDDENAYSPDPDGLDLLGCTACGESFEHVEDLQRHLTESCAEAGLDTGDNAAINSATEKNLRANYDNPTSDDQGHESNHTSSPVQLKGRCSCQSSKSPTDSALEGGDDRLRRNADMDEACELNIDLQGSTLMSERPRATRCSHCTNEQRAPVP